MTALADALDAVRGEQTSRVAAQQDLEKRAAEATSRVKPQDEGPGRPDAPTDEAPADAAPADAAPTDLPPDAPPDVPADAPVDVPVDAAPPADAPPARRRGHRPRRGRAPTEEEKKKKAAPTGTFEAAETVPEPEPVRRRRLRPRTSRLPQRTPDARHRAHGRQRLRRQSRPRCLPAEPTAVSTTPPAQNEEIPVAASATDVVVTPPAENRPVPRQSASVAITAGADIPGISAGTELTSASQVTDAFMKRLHNLQRVSSRRTASSTRSRR